jgi:hypothetical protein
MVRIMRLRLQGGSPLRGFQRESFQRLGTGASVRGVAAHDRGAAFIEA